MGCQASTQGDPTTDHTADPMLTFPPCHSSPDLPRTPVLPRFRRDCDSPRTGRFGRQLPSCRRCAPWPFMIVIQCRQGGNIMASGPPSCSCSRYLWEGYGEEVHHIAQPRGWVKAERQVGYHRRGIGRGTVCESQALTQAAGTGRASSELAIRRLSSLRLWFRPHPRVTRAHAT